MKNSFTQDLLKVVGIKNYKGLLVEFKSDGSVVWSNKVFGSLEMLDKYLDELYLKIKKSVV